MGAWKMGIQGDDLAKNLRKLPEGLTRTVLYEALRLAAEPMRAHMAQNAPRGKEAPHMADNMVVSVTNQVGEAGGVGSTRRFETEAYVAIGPAREFFYAFFQEMGWVYHPAGRPFARPAFDSNVGTSLNVLGQALWAAVREQAAKGVKGA